MPCNPASATYGNEPCGDDAANNDQCDSLASRLEEDQHLLLLVQIEDHCGNRSHGCQQPTNDSGQLVQNAEM